MSNPKILFFDTGILLALFNNDKREEAIACKAAEYFSEHRQASRHVILPCLIELFYKIQKSRKLSPKDIKSNFDALSILPFSVSAELEQKILDSYFEISFKNEFDYADYFLSCVALDTNHAAILTIDRNDLPLALATAYKSGLFPTGNVVQLIPVS